MNRDFQTKLRLSKITPDAVEEVLRNNKTSHGKFINLS